VRGFFLIFRPPKEDLIQRFNALRSGIKVTTPQYRVQTCSILDKPGPKTFLRGISLISNYLKNGHFFREEQLWLHGTTVALPLEHQTH
jgi:hypothetical protein